MQGQERKKLHSFMLAAHEYNRLQTTHFYILVHIVLRYNTYLRNREFIYNNASLAHTVIFFMSLQHNIYHNTHSHNTLK